MQIKNNIKRALLAATFCLGTQITISAKQVVLWNWLTVIKQDNMGIGTKFLGFGLSMWAIGKDEKIQQSLFDLFARLPEGSQPDNEFTVNEPNFHLALPVKMCDWQAGEVDSITMKSLGQKQVAKLEDGNMKKALKALVDFTFTPESLAAYTKYNSDAVKLMSKMKESGKISDQYVIGNFDAETFDILANAKDMKKLFNNIKHPKNYISGYTGTLLPQKEAFKHFLKEEKLEAKDVIFISGQKRQIKVAKELGMKTILVEDNKPDKAKDELKKLGLYK